MPIRPALRAALVVSGLSLTAGCGGTATLREESTTPSDGSDRSDTSNTSNTTDSSNTVVDASQPCDPNVEPTTQACCDERGGRMWDASSGSCLWMAVPGPFVPPAMNG